MMLADDIVTQVRYSFGSPDPIRKAICRICCLFINAILARFRSRICGCYWAALPCRDVSLKCYHKVRRGKTQSRTLGDRSVGRMLPLDGLHRKVTPLKIMTYAVNLKYRGLVSWRRFDSTQEAKTTRICLIFFFCGILVFLHSFFLFEWHCEKKNDFSEFDSAVLMHMLELLLLGLEFDSFETETDGRFYLSSQTAIWRKILSHASERNPQDFVLTRFNNLSGRQFSYVAISHCIRISWQGHR